MLIICEIQRKLSFRMTLFCISLVNNTHLVHLLVIFMPFIRIDDFISISITISITLFMEWFICNTFKLVNMHLINHNDWPLFRLVNLNFSTWNICTLPIHSRKQFNVFVFWWRKSLLAMPFHEQDSNWIKSYIIKLVI